MQRNEVAEIRRELILLVVTWILSQARQEVICANLYSCLWKGIYLYNHVM